MAKRRVSSEVELNLAAMLDMAFQILTFFILTFRPAPVEAQIQLRMPPPQALAMANAKQDPGNIAKSDPTRGTKTLHLVLTAAADGALDKIYLLNQEVTVDPKLAMLDAELKKQLGPADTSFDQVIIQVGSKLKYEELMRVLGVCAHQTVGGDPKNKLSKLSLVADQEENP